MTKFVTLLVQGVAEGALYALVAMGFVIIYKANRVLNFAHGALMLLGATVVAFTHDQLGFYGAAILGLVATGLVATIFQYAVIQPVRGATPEVVTILTIGVDVILATALTNVLGTKLRVLGHPWGGSNVHLGSVSITVNQLIGLIVAAVLIAVFFIAFSRSSWGMSMRAAAEDPEAAALVGLRLNRIMASAWFVAGFLACVAGIFLTGAPASTLSSSLADLGLVALPAAIIGGLTSIYGALIGGLVIGVVASLTTGYQDKLHFLGNGFGTVVPFILLLLVLLVRPEGLFADKRGARV